MRLSLLQLLVTQKLPKRSPLQYPMLPQRSPKRMQMRI